MARAEGPLWARFLLCIVGGAIAGMVVGLVQAASDTKYGSESGIPGVLIGGAVIGTGVGYLFWLKRFWRHE